LVQEEQVLDELLSRRLGYPHTNGLPELRERIAALYPGASPENVLVTNGCAEANFNSVLTVLQPGDEILVMLPNYMQIWGVAQNFGFALKTFSLQESSGWGVDLDGLDRAVNAKTKLIAICNPNNPTGHILSQTELGSILEKAGEVGAWVLADEVYAGTERLQEEVTPSVWGQYEKVLATGSLSKAYALPGLRLGWVVAPRGMVQQIWARQDYTTISASLLSNVIATYALRHDVRNRLLDRARKYVREGYSLLEGWLEEHPQLFQLHPPQAAAIAFVRYDLEISSTALWERLIHEKSVLVVPGDHFGHDHHLRISFGLPREYLLEGLRRIMELFLELKR
jgi:aspartate/methionine/tyrosine aminotransferase